MGKGNDEVAIANVPYANDGVATRVSLGRGRDIINWRETSNIVVTDFNSKKDLIVEGGIVNQTDVRWNLCENGSFVIAAQFVNQSYCRGAIKFENLSSPDQLNVEFEDSNRELSFMRDNNLIFDVTTNV